jgi:hypothetical protein
VRLRDVEFDHLHHGRHDPLHLRGVGVADELHEHARDDLPGEAVPVLQPAARLGLAAAGRAARGAPASPAILCDTGIKYLRTFGAAVEAAV